MMRRAALALAAFVAACHAQTPGPEIAVNTPAFAYPAADLARGARLAQTCLGCHGEGASLDDPVAMRAPRLRHQRPGIIFSALLDYRNRARAADIMGPIASAMSEQDMRDVSAYLAGPRIRPEAVVITDPLAHARAVESCGACHGEAGLGVMEGYPLIAGQSPAYLSRALAEYRSGVRYNSTMRAVLSQVDLAHDPGLIAYFSAQPGLERPSR